MKSIAQATAINENGLYYVGNIENYSEKFKVYIYQRKCGPFFSNGNNDVLHF